MARNTNVNANDVPLTEKDVRFYGVLQDVLKLVTELSEENNPESAIWKAKIPKYNAYIKQLAPKK